MSDEEYGEEVEEPCFVKENSDDYESGGFGGFLGGALRSLQGSGSQDPQGIIPTEGEFAPAGSNYGGKASGSSGLGGVLFGALKDVLGPGNQPSAPPPPQGYGGYGPPQGYGGYGPPQGYGGYAPPQGYPPPQGYGPPQGYPGYPPPPQQGGGGSNDVIGGLLSSALKSAFSGGNKSSNSGGGGGSDIGGFLSGALSSAMGGGQQQKQSGGGGLGGFLGGALSSAIGGGGKKSSGGGGLGGFLGGALSSAISGGGGSKQSSQPADSGGSGGFLGGILSNALSSAVSSQLHGEPGGQGQSSSFASSLQTVGSLLPLAFKLYGIGQTDNGQPSSLISEFGDFFIGQLLRPRNRPIPDTRKFPDAPDQLGERGSGLRPRGEVQEFETIRAQCLEEGTVFCDPEFPATDETIFFSRSPPKPFEWKRPHELVDDPALFVEGVSRFDVKQGELGDCWLLAAVANLTLNKKLFLQVVPSDQNFQDLYAGIFHFRFWQYGRWIDVVIDDRLPTYRGRLVFMHSTSNREFWSALLEKAYAKIFGSYEALKGGTTMEAMEDFTGGVTEMFDLDKAPSNLFTIMLKASDRFSLMGSSIEPDPNILEAETPEGLIKGHAYSLTSIKLVDISTPRVSGKIPLIRVRNPWGNEAEWKGAWSDRSQEWQFIPDEEKQELGLTFTDDGEFWMSFKDFLTRFHRVEICNLSPDSLEEEELANDPGKRWEMSVYEGSWITGATAGGCRNYLETFCHNPQYCISLEDPDDDDDDDKCTVIVALMQKNRRAKRKLGMECLTIGFAIYHLKDPDSVSKPLDMRFFKYNASVARSPSFINLREVSCRFKLPPGTYCIVPSTFEPNEEGEFLLRVFSEKRNNMQEHDQELGFRDVDDRVKLEEKPQESEEDQKFRQLFTTIAGVDMEIDWKELQEILDLAFKKEFPFDGFSKDVCRSMIAMLDIDRSGKLGLEEFKTLWKDIRNWKSVFKMYDRESNGQLDSFELRQTLNSAGYNLNNRILNALVLRYGDKSGHMKFDDFILCATRLKTMIDAFKARDPNNTNLATFSMEEWVEKTLYS